MTTVLKQYKDSINRVASLSRPSCIHSAELDGDGTVCSLVVSCAAVIAQATSREVDEINATLTRQSLRCSDESLRFELSTALQYVLLRPFRYTIRRAVPLNINLPFTVINLPFTVISLCITYIIVLLQLTHFYV